VPINITEFLADDLFTLPVLQPPKQDFKLFVFRQLDAFHRKLSSLCADNTYFNDVGHYPLERICQRQGHLITQIKETLNSYFDGKPAKAFSCLSEGLISRLKDFNDVLNEKDFFPGENFYRLRLHKENYPLPINDFFHIPFEKRGLVKTQRFSIPGFPSLYLGTSVYLCWEELNRPNLNDFQAVRISTLNKVRVIDLSPPRKDSNNPQELYKYLMIWPLVMCSSIKVRESADHFKPEYIIPQLLLQWVREKQGIDGIAYQTTHMDFKDSLAEGDFVNVVFPVKDNKSRGLCDHLKSKFQMTNATSIQLTQCAVGGANTVYASRELNLLNNRLKKIEMIPGRATSYGNSILGSLERNLNALPLYPIGAQQDDIAEDEPI
jgi:hypothetical protein